MKKPLTVAWVSAAVFAAFAGQRSFAQEAQGEKLGEKGREAGASITFTRVPPPTLLPGPAGMDAIAGSVTGVDVQQCKVVIYALGDIWYVQPTAARPLTDIGKNGKWETDTHGGSEYAALLVKSTYRPRPTVAALPQVGDDVLAIVVVKSEPDAPVKTISFSGYDWTVKSSDGRVGPGPNYFSDSTDNVWVDNQGRLHLRMANRDKEWYCAEVISKKSFGYGTYRFYIDSGLDNLDPNVILGMFTWSDETAYSNREIDVECSKWMDAEGRITAQFVVQPYDVREHLHRFPLPAGLTQATYGFTWKDDGVSFSAFKGHVVTPGDAEGVIRDGEWAFGPKGVPQAGGENARINLWLMGGRPPKTEQPAEVIVKRFEFVRAE